MTVKELLEEYNLEIDDVRWYLSEVLTERLLSMQNSPQEITKMIWSGALSDELYDMEERYLRTLQDQLNEKTLDENHLRDTLSEMEMIRRRRHGY